MFVRNILEDERVNYSKECKSEWQCTNCGKKFYKDKFNDDKLGFRLNKISNMNNADLRKNKINSFIEHNNITIQCIIERMEESAKIGNFCTNIQLICTDEEIRNYQSYFKDRCIDVEYTVINYVGKVNNVDVNDYNVTLSWKFNRK